MNRKSPIYVLAFMAAVSVVFGTGVSLVHYATQGMLERNAELHRNRVLCRAFMLEVDGKSAEAYAAAVEKNIKATEVPDGEGTRRTYTRTDGSAVGFEFGGIGFWDRITGVIVLEPDLSRILNIQFLEQKETPGLGARIEEKWFTEQFKGLPVAWDAAKDARVIVGSAPDPNAENRVDAITGATQTSLALMRFLNSELNRIRRLDVRSTDEVSGVRFQVSGTAGEVPSELKPETRNPKPET